MNKVKLSGPMVDNPYTVAENASIAEADRHGAARRGGPIVAQRRQELRASSPAVTSCWRLTMC